MRVNFSQSECGFHARQAVNDKSSGVKGVPAQRPVGSAASSAASAAKAIAACQPPASRAPAAPAAGDVGIILARVSPEFDRFMRIGERLERGLEELKDIQWQIRENEVRYRDLLDTQANVILRRDAQGRLTFVNQAFCSVFGGEREDVLGRPFVHRVL